VHCTCLPVVLWCGWIHCVIMRTVVRVFLCGGCFLLFATPSDARFISDGVENRFLIVSHFRLRPCTYRILPHRPQSLHVPMQHGTTACDSVCAERHRGGPCRRDTHAEAPRTTRAQRTFILPIPERGRCKDSAMAIRGWATYD
jgi:hypothetical protein